MIITASKTLTSAGTTANAALPVSPTGSVNRVYIRLVSDLVAGCFVKFGVDNTVVATANDILIVNEPELFHLASNSWIAVLQNGAGAKLNISVVETAGP